MARKQEKKTVSERKKDGKKAATEEELDQREMVHSKQRRKFLFCKYQSTKECR